MARVKKLICFTLFLIIFISCVGILPKSAGASSGPASPSNNSEWRDVDVSLRENNDIQIEEVKKTIDLGGIADAVAKMATIPANAAINTALIGVEKVMLTFVNVAIAWGAQAVNFILTNGNDIGNDKTNTGLVEIWTAVRNISLSLLTLGLIIIAFANVLNIDTAKYGLQQMIPKIIFSIFMAYFSFFLARLILELCSALQMGLIGLYPQAEIFDSNFLKLITFKDANIFTLILSDSGTLLAKTLFTILLLIGVVFAMLWLVIILIVRTAMIWILVAVAPLAFILYIMPFSEGYYKQWWEQFFKWAFMGPVVALLLWVTTKLVGSYASMTTIANVADGNSWFILIMIAVGIYLAATIPLQMGGDPMKMVSGLMSKYGKKGLGLAAERSGLSGAWGAIKAEGKRKDQRRALSLVGGIAEKHPTIGKMVGITPRLKAGAQDAAISEYAKDFALMKEFGMRQEISKYFKTDANGDIETHTRADGSKRATIIGDQTTALGLARAIGEANFLPKGPEGNAAMMATASDYDPGIATIMRDKDGWIGSALNNDVWTGNESEATTAGQMKNFYEKVVLGRPLQKLDDKSLRYLAEKMPEKLAQKLDSNSVAAAIRSEGFDDSARSQLTKAIRDIRTNGANPQNVPNGNAYRLASGKLTVAIQSDPRLGALLDDLAQKYP